MAKSDQDKILLIIPTYNEADNIEKLIELIQSEIATASVLVVDDNSPDGCGEIVEKLKISNPKLDIIKRTGKLGLGTAYLEGFKYAIEKG